MMTIAWMDRVDKYLNALQLCVEDLNESLDNTRMGTTSLDTERTGKGTDQLSACLKRLESLIADRQELLDAEDAPHRGVSLRDVLNRCSDVQATRLSGRCHQLSRDIDMSRERAVALFVCQFHLGDLSTHLLALLRSGADHGSTYQSGKADVMRTGAANSVFNKAA